MSIPLDAPCVGWGVIVTSCPDIDITPLSATQTTMIRDFAEGWMYVETGRRFTGICTGTVEPPDPRGGGCFVGRAAWASTYYSVTTSGTADHIDLYDYFGQRVENIDVTSVEVNGVTLDNSLGAHWRFKNGRYLIAMRNGALWPWPNQDTHTPMGSENTWRINVNTGRVPPASVFAAAQDLQCELLRSALNLPCDVPKNAVVVSRHGMTVQLEPGFRGIPSIRAACTQYPKRRLRRPRVYDPRRIASATASR